MTIAIPKLTFRMHDNPLMDGSDGMIVVLEEERSPNVDPSTSMNNCCWSFHQFNLLLQVLINLERRLGAGFLALMVQRRDLEHVFSTVGSKCDKIVTDHITDPAFNHFEEALGILEDKVEYLSTFTLLDWRQEPHLQANHKYWSSAKVYSKLDPLERHILDTIDIELAQRTYKSEDHKYRLPKFKGLDKYRLDLSSLLVKTRATMSQLGMRPHLLCIAIDTVDFDEKLLEYASQRIKSVDTDTWNKPDTAVGVDFGWQFDEKDRNTTQLSPFLSIGALSVRTLWSLIKGERNDNRSIRGQLIWRECFHATAIGAETIEGGRITQFWNNQRSVSDVNTFVKESDVDWIDDKELFKNKKALYQWQTGKMEGEMHDANESMQKLWINGWIHHLRRHLVADTLTRGRLKIDWRQGERWFRHTLIDHDAAVNRANWMWLAAVAFSSKQKVYHYSPLDYVRRRDKNVGQSKPILVWK